MQVTSSPERCRLACVVFSFLSGYRHLQTWLMTNTWFWKVLDIYCACPPTDRALLHAHTTHLATEASLLPFHDLRDEDTTYNSFRHELKEYIGFTIIIIIINAKIKVTLNKKIVAGALYKNYHNTLSVSKGGLEQSCLQIPAKRLQ